MRVAIHVMIFKDQARRWLNVWMGIHKDNPGVTWKDSELIFSGDSLEEVDYAALCFYESIMEDTTLANVRARMRHRFGRNGHGWPPLQGDQIDWTPIKDALAKLRGRSPYKV